MKSWNRYGCVPSLYCHCPKSFEKCSGWAALKAAAEKGDPVAVSDLEQAQRNLERRRAAKVVRS
jgi:hypothetical protein